MRSPPRPARPASEEGISATGLVALQLETFEVPVSG